MNENKKLWFKRKTYGWGWTPTSWEGWVVIAIYVLLITPIFFYSDNNLHSAGDTILGAVLPFIILTSGLIFICYKKGESPKWQWGTDNNVNKKLQLQVGVGVMIFKDGKVLMGKRKNSFGAGEYCFPGGHLEYMESFEECAIREVKEECGLEIKNIKFVQVGNSDAYKPKHYITIGFSADWAGGEAALLEPEKCEGWDWYDIDHLPEPLLTFSKKLADAYKTGKNYYDKENNND